MPSATPNGIAFPVVGDEMSPLATWFAGLAGTTDNAIEALRTELLAAPLPNPLSQLGAPQQLVTSSSWADVPNISAVTLTLDQACWVTISIGAWLFTTAGDIRVSAAVSGATTLGETQLEVGGAGYAWGQVLFADTSTATRQQSGLRTVRMNAGTNTIKLRAYRSGAGTSACNYSTIQVSPVRWA